MSDDCKSEDILTPQQQKDYLAEGTPAYETREYPESLAKRWDLWVKAVKG